MTVRFHTIDPYTIQSLKNQLKDKNDKSTVEKEAVFDWTKPADDNSDHSNDDFHAEVQRAPVLTDLRSGGGFTFILKLKMSNITNDNGMLVNGISTVSGSLGS